MDTNYYKQYEPIFGAWRIAGLIGEGSFGKVYEIERKDFGTTYKAALKVITVPANESEIKEVMAEGMDEASARDYFGSFVQDLVKEFALMSKLKGNSNVVSYEDHQVIEHKNGIGWDILIRMELLTPLNEYIRKHPVTRQDVIRLGADLCRALELCQKYNIIHRDVKPENIFISDSGDFKLGDFGIARTVEKTTSGLSKKGTYSYMAPEVYKGEAYNSSVDIYSLGIVLYRLLNDNRTPFLPAAPAPITHNDRETALARRFSGTPLPLPVHGEGRLGEIVMKACAYDPKERYSSPMQMRQELEAILYSREEGRLIYPEGDQVPQDSVHYVKTGEEDQEKKREDRFRKEEKTVSDFGKVDSGMGNRDAGEKKERKHVPGPQPADGRTEKKEKRPEKKRSMLVPIAAGACVLAVGIGVLSLGGGKKSQSHEAQTAETAAAAAGEKETAEAAVQALDDSICIGVYDVPEQTESSDDYAELYRWGLEAFHQEYPEAEFNGKETGIRLIFASEMEGDYPINKGNLGRRQSNEAYAADAADFFREQGCAAVISVFDSYKEELAEGLLASGIPVLIVEHAGRIDTEQMEEDGIFIIEDVQDFGMGKEEMDIIGQFLAEELGAGSVLYVDQYTAMTDKSYVQELAAELEQWGMSTEIFWYEKHSRDALASKLLEGETWDVIYSDMNDRQDWEMVWEQTAFSSPLVIWSTAGYNNLDLWNPEIDGYYFDFRANGKKDEELSHIADLVEEKHDCNPLILQKYIAGAIDAYQVVTEALPQCSDTADLADAIRNVSLDGYSGTFRFDEEGRSEYTSVSYWHNGEWENYYFVE